MNPLWAYDVSVVGHYRGLAGVDEAGRGCLAGPVVAGAVIVGREFFANPAWAKRVGGINDSKVLTADQRRANCQVIHQLAEEKLLTWAVAEGSVAEIEQYNILGANRLAMQRALQLAAARGDWTLPAGVTELFPSASAELLILVDGLPLKSFPWTHRGIVRGDAQSLVIAMASNLAKVHRDGVMVALHEQYPQYGWAEHKGYATQGHFAAIARHGPSPHHRALFLRKFHEREQSRQGELASLWPTVP